MFSIGPGTEQWEQLLPQRNYWGGNWYILLPQFFCNLQLKVTLQIVRLLLTQKFSKIPQLLGLCPRTHCALRIHFSEKYILRDKVIL